MGENIHYQFNYSPESSRKKYQINPRGIEEIIKLGAEINQIETKNIYKVSTKLGAVALRKSTR